MRVAAVATLSLSLALTGCSLSPTAAPAPDAGLSLQGAVHGGQQPIVGAHVYLFAANTTGYGGAGLAASASNASVSLLNAASTGNSDSVGAYVLSGTGGAFTITGDYTCTPNTQVYLYALGGNPGAGANSASGLLAALGNCPSSGNFLASTPFIIIDEVSTIASAYAMAGFATDATHVSSSGTTLAKTGIANAFANVANLETISGGTAYATTPAGNGAVPQATINSLANFLGACVNTNGAITGPTSPTSCYTLLNNALSSGATGAIPTDTATAAINIAHNPGANVTTLCGLQTGTPPFLPDLPCISTSGYPTDFNLAIAFTGAGLNTDNSAVALAIDAAGNAWVANWLGSSVDEFTNLGSPAANSPFTTGGISAPEAIAIDLSGNVWTANTGNNSITKLTSAGAAVSGSSGYTGGGLFQSYGIAVDASNNIWLSDGGLVTKFTNAGAPVPVNGYNAAGITTNDAVAIDASGNAWFAGDNVDGPDIFKVIPTGATATGYAVGGTANSGNLGIAIDSSGDVWSVSETNISKLSSTGTAISTSSGYTGAGLSVPKGGIAIDGAGNVWVTNTGTDSVAEWSNAGVAISPSTGYKASPNTSTLPLSIPEPVAIDGSGNVWIGSAGNKEIVEYIGAATPVVTPLAAAVAANMIATRP